MGYDRSQGQGPWLVARMVRWLRRDAGMVALDHVHDIDWHNGHVRVGSALSPMTPAGTTGEPEGTRG